MFSTTPGQARIKILRKYVQMRFRMGFGGCMGPFASPGGPLGSCLGLLRAPWEPRWALKGAERSEKSSQDAPQEHQKRPQHMEITIHRPCRRFRACQVTIYRPCRVIMSAEKRSKERPSHDPSALSTFQSLKVLRIRILEGWRPPSSIRSLLLNFSGAPWDPCKLTPPRRQPSIRVRF